MAVLYTFIHYSWSFTIQKVRLFFIFVGRASQQVSTAAEKISRRKYCGVIRDFIRDNFIYTCTCT